MTKPMYCPMSFMPISVIQYINTGETFKREYEPMECTPDCAWAVNVNGKYSCCFPVIARILSDHELNINFRPLEDDAE